MDLTERLPPVVRSNLGVAGVLLAYLVAGIHLLHPKLGIPRLVLLLSTGEPTLLATHPRPLVFVLTGIAIIVGVTIAIWGYRRRLVYALGIALMATYLVGYFAWHFTGHGGFLPNREPLLHGVGPLENVVNHLSTDVYALVSKVAELLLLIVLVVLYSAEPADGPARPSDDTLRP